MQRTCPSGHAFEAPEDLPEAVCPRCHATVAPPGPRPWRLLSLAGLAILLVALGALGTWWWMRAGAPPGAEGLDPRGAAERTLQRLIDLDQFQAARDHHAALPPELREALQIWPGRIDQAELEHRARIRVFQIVIEELTTVEALADEELFARVLVEGQVVHTTRALPRRFEGEENPLRRLEAAFPVRTSHDLGLQLEITDAGGDPLVPREDLLVVTLEQLEEGAVELGYPAPDHPRARLRRMRVRYVDSPLHQDPETREQLLPERGDPPAGTPADIPALLEVAREALEMEALQEAQRTLDAVGALQPAHDELPGLRARLQAIRAAIMEGETTYEMVLADLMIDPRPGGDPWFRVGEQRDLLVQVTRGEEALTEALGPVAPHLLPDRLWASPGRNRFHVTCRGRDELRIRVLLNRTWPRSDEEIGALLLDRRMGEYPRPEGQIVLEHRPADIILPAEEPNRLRRLVLYYRVLEGTPRSREDR